MAKASDQNGFDGEGRKPGEQTGLDTRVPGRKRCELGVAQTTGLCSVEKKLLNSPPGKYGRKTETLRN